jgi:hypothetical protein
MLDVHRSGNEIKLDISPTDLLRDALSQSLPFFMRGAR